MYVNYFVTASACMAYKVIYNTQDCSTQDSNEMSGHISWKYIKYETILSAYS